MVRNKKVLMAVSFCLGAVMFATTAFADMASKTGYDQLKDAVKNTAEACSEKLQSLTMEVTMTMKDNDKVIASNNSVQKIDNVKKMVEESAVSEDLNSQKSSSYSYRDSNGTIWYNPQNDTYYINELKLDGGLQPVNNPFKEERAKDMEKILDALVGNLKDYVVVDEKVDGSKELSGSLNEGQIPALVNAVASFGFKNILGGSRGMSGKLPNVPQMLDDVFVKSVTGKASVNKDGVIESLLATGVLSGTDKDGKLHNLTVEVLGKIYDINATAVSKPDLTGKKVEKQISKMSDKGITKKFIGKYRNDIVIDKDDSFIKIGERTVEIVGIDDKHIEGRYFESYKEQYAAEYGKNKLDFRFDAVLRDNYNAEFEYTTSSGNKQTGTINFDIAGGKFYFSIPSEMQGVNGMFDPSFSRVFD